MHAPLTINIKNSDDQSVIYLSYTHLHPDEEDHDQILKTGKNVIDAKDFLSKFENEYVYLGIMAINPCVCSIVYWFKGAAAMGFEKIKKNISFK